MSVILIGSKLIIDGFLYHKSRDIVEKNKTYWDCTRLRKKECRARAITSLALHDSVPEIFKGPQHASHDHAPDPDECQAEITKFRMKNEGEQHPERPPSRVLQDEMRNLPPRVLARLPDRENLKRSIRKARRRILPQNPKTLSDIQDLPDNFKVTLTGDRFLIHDSGDENGKILVFSTRRNLQLLQESDTWFLDGTFKVAPVLFCQLFTVLGIIKRNTMTVALPLVFALLTSKEQSQYSTVLRAITSSCDELHIPACRPTRIMTDFEQGIINASRNVFEDCTMTCCFFHLGQSLYRKVQENGLQAAYQSLDDTVRSEVHMLLALAFIPIIDVPCVFRKFAASATACLEPVLKYFEAVYVGVPARGRRRAKAPRYSPEIWNQREAALNGDHKTNNVSEGWHNRFRLLVGKNHPDLFSLLTEIQKEQADTDIAVTELCLGRKVRAAPKKKWIEYHIKIQRITTQYDSFKEDGKDLEFLGLIGSNIIAL